MDVEGLSIRALQRLDAAASRLRHSLVEACFYNLRILAQELPGRRGNGDFAERLDEALARVKEARALIDAHFAYEVAPGLTIGDLFPLQERKVAAALEKIESLAATGAPSREDAGACREFSDHVVESVDALMDAIGVMEAEVAALRTPARPLLDELAGLHRASCGEMGVEIAVENHAESEVQLLCDRPDMLNALGELVRNALRHAFDGTTGEGRVTLGIARDADTRDPVITVSDNGLGMEPERVALLGAASASTSGGGDGVALVRRVVEGQHGGLVTFRSAPGEGTRVEVRLPRRSEPELREEPPAEATPRQVRVPLSRRRVLAAALALLGMLALGIGGAWYALRSQAAGRLTVAADGTGDFLRIGDAIAAARGGATIAVAPGEYVEQLVLDKGVHIAGPSDRGARLRAAEGPVVISSAEGGALRNLRISLEGQVDAAAVYVRDGDLLIEDCEISSAGLSCLEVAGGQPTVTDSLIHRGARSGLFVHGESGGTYEGLEVRDCEGSGIAVSDAADPFVHDSVVKRCTEGGVNVYAGGRGTFERVEIFHCARGGFIVGEGGDPVVRSCEIHDNPDDGIAVMEGGRGTFEHNEVWGNGRNGIVVGAGGVPTLRGNQAEGNGTHQVWMMGDSAVSVEWEAPKR